MQFALTYAPNAFDLRGKIMGRQSAGLSFLRAALQAGPERIWCYAASRAQAEVFGRDVLALSATPPELRFIPWEAPGRLANAGLLYRADPGIGDDAWHRRHHAGARAYSLCGITHTISSHAAMSTIAGLLRAPLYPWDAVICTSTVARDVIRQILEAEMDYLRERVGATTFTLPQLPMIPLGVHAGDFVFGPDQRAEARQALDIAPDDVAFLFAGRLTFHGKAHPLPMFLALQDAAVSTKRRLHLVLFGKFNSDKIGEVFADEARRFMPDVRLLVLDGGSDTNRDQAWAAADIFTSLSDNIQETFGLTPVEGMAAGLPVVVSDWNGYKDTVRDGIDGFKVPIALPPPGTGRDLADRHAHQIDDYDMYIGAACQFAAVDIAATVEAYRRLIESPDLRQRMGAAGRRRAREIYDWAVIFGRYRALWDDLAEHRRADPRAPGEDSRAPRPDRPDPFALFRTYPSMTLGPETMIRLRPGGSAERAAERRTLQSVGYASATLPPPEIVASLIGALASDRWTALGTVESALGKTSRPALFRATAWLAKMGIIEVSRPEP